MNLPEVFFHVCVGGFWSCYHGCFVRAMHGRCRCRFGVGFDAMIEVAGSDRTIFSQVAPHGLSAKILPGFS